VKICNQSVKSVKNMVS